MGIFLDPALWTDNGKTIELVYNIAESQVAFIEVCSHCPLFDRLGYGVNLMPFTSFSGLL
jgi:hypothetical protein